MQSFKSKFINWLLRNRHLLKGKKRKERFDENTSIAAFREECERGARRFGKIPKGVSVKEDNIAGLRCEWLLPVDAGPDKVILYVHGGGYVSGSCSDHRSIVSKFAKNAGFATLLYEYRLAPEHTYPAAVEDSVAVYRELLSRGFKPGNILVAGESAGGGLCLALLLAIKEQGIPHPAAAVAISPWTDLSCSGDSYKTKNKYSLAPLDSWFVFSRHYCGSHDPRTPLISPLFGDLAGLPPLFINSGTDDELYDDGERFYFKAKAAGVDVTFRSGEGMVHCYPLLAPMFREASEAMDEILEFVKTKLGACSREE